jgi:hypothetical protein
MEVLGDISKDSTQKTTCASYGSHLDSWFFAYELADGTCAFRVGSAIPAALRQFLEKIGSSAHLRSDVRVQLGDNDSFVSWAKTSWACRGVPEALETALCQLSSAHVKSTTITRGSFKHAVNQLTWHSDGSYYVGSEEESSWNFSSSITLQAWRKLWLKTNRSPSFEELSELVVSSIPSSL